MAIERPNSFHLMLSGDELTLLRLLADREGLNASDYLRTLMRREAGSAGATPLARTRDALHLIGPEAVEKAWSGQPLMPSRAKSAKRPKRR